MTPLRVGAAVGLLAAAAYAVTLPDYGLVSDEGNYFESSRRLFGWADHFAESLRDGEPGRSLSDDVLEQTWRWGGDRIPHPPFAREVAGLSGFLFYGRMDPLTAYRLLGTLLAGALAGGIAAWGTLRGGGAGGIVAGLGFVVLPRVFAHAHFADTDFVLSALLFASLFCAAEKRRAPLAWAGAFWGLALATKFSALLLPVVLVPWLALFRRDRLRGLPAFAALAAAAFAAVNPAVWADPLAAGADYLRQGFGRRGIDMAQLPTFYLGRVYSFRPPWHYPLVMLVLTLPPGLLLLACAGALRAARRADPARPTAVLAVLVPAAFLGALALPSAPLHDDVRLLLPAFPFLALLAGLGAARLAESPRERAAGAGAETGAARPGAAPGLRTVPRAIRLGAVALVALALLQPAFAVARLHPYQASYFNVFAGGLRGAQARGLEVTGMKEALNRETYADLNGILPRGATLDGGPFLHEDLLFAQSAGWLDRSVVVRREPPSDYVLLVNRRGWLRRSDAALLDRARPAYAVLAEGVPLVALYRLR